MAMNWMQKHSRRDARYWGKAALGNLSMVLWAVKQASSWSGIADTLERQLETRSLDATDRADTESARDHARGRVKRLLELADAEEERVKVNARRAAHAALRSGTVAPGTEGDPSFPSTEQTAAYQRDRR